jgi:hypothetical protein
VTCTHTCNLCGCPKVAQTGGAVHSVGTLLRQDPVFSDKGYSLAHELNKRADDSQVALDSNVHESSGLKERVDISEVLASWPVVDLHNLGVVWDVAVKVTFVT